MSDTLNIYWDRRLAGRLRLDEKRNFIFQYEPSWLTGADAHALSVRLPLRPEPFLADTVENEVFCMLLAGKCGLPVPEVSVFGSKHRCCLVERYDRKPGTDFTPVRLHQEDFCQALGYGYDQKYEAEGGPGLKACFTLLTEYSTEPLRDRRNMLRWVVFNYLIGNCDAHAKNISMLLSGAARLAPFYDLMSTVVYPELTDKMAMKVGGENKPKWVMKRHWQRFAADAGVGEKAVFGVSKELAETLPALSAALGNEFVEKYGAEDTIRKIRNHIAEMSEDLLAL